MKRHLNTLFVTTQDTWLAKDGECVELRLDGKPLGRIPLHPFLKERMSVDMLCHMQARLLARYIRGDMDAYPPFAMR